MSHFSKHYKQLNDDALVDLALRGGLVAEAEQALRAELRSRGLSDLSEETESRNAEAASEERYRQEQLARRATILK